MKNRILSLAAMATLCIGLAACGDDDAEVKNVLITSNRETGQFYKLDLTTGEATPIFTIEENGNTITDVRAFVYHPAQNKFFISQHSYPFIDGSESGSRLGHLYSVNVDTKEATMINNNDGKNNSASSTLEYPVWDAIVNWAVDEDDSLISIGDYNGNEDNAIVKFGVDGKRSLTYLETDFCCGGGMFYNAETGIFTIGNGWDTNDGEVAVDLFAKTGGAPTSSTVINTFEGFPADFNESYQDSNLYLKGLATDPKDASKTIYGLLMNSSIGKTYFVKIDVANEEVIFISTLGEDDSNTYNTFAFIPENLAK